MEVPRPRRRATAVILVLFRGAEKDPIRRRLVDLVARRADTIHAKTIAEAIEREAQLQIGRDLGIQYGQGFLFAAPAPWKEVRQWHSSRGAS